MWCEGSIQCILLGVDVRGSQPHVSDRLHSPPRSAPGVLVENHLITDKRVYFGMPHSIPLVCLSVTALLLITVAFGDLQLHSAFSRLFGLFGAP